MKNDYGSHGPARRDILRGGGLLLVAASAAACDAFSTEPAGKKQDGTQSLARDSEVPMLAPKVKRGELPPVKDRIPRNPLLIKPVERVGDYGGTARLPLTAPTDPLVYLTMGYDGLVRWDPEWKDVVPNLAESIEAADDARSYTVKLRAGTKWSDGEPFTTDDIMFVFDDVILVKELVPEVPGWLATGGTPATVTALNKLTVRFEFTEPNAMFLQNLATPAGNVFTAIQRRYFSRFHKKYNKDLETLVQDSGAEDWAELFISKGGTVNGMVDTGYWQNPELPTLCAWQLTAPLGKSLVTKASRNAYYCKTDPDGNQLPYLDELAFDLISNEETILLKATNGEIDIEDYWPPFTLTNKPLFARHQQTGNYRFVDVIPASMNQLVIALNLTHEDPQMREIFQNKEFRTGPSHAINRKEIINAAFQRQGEPWQAAPRKESAYYLKELATQYTEYDVDRANDHLDRAGYTKRDGEGFRLRPDGERIRFQVDSSGTSKVLELVRTYWQDVGVDMSIKTMSRSLFYNRKSANKHDANAWNGDGGLQDAIMDPRWYFPYSSESNYAVPWAAWYQSGGETGTKPPAPARDQMQLYDQIQRTADQTARQDLFMRILEIAAEQFYTIGTVLPVGNYGVVPNDIRNVPEPIYRAWLNPNPGSERPEQFFRSHR